MSTETEPDSGPELKAEAGSDPGSKSVSPSALILRQPRGTVWGLRLLFVTAALGLVGLVGWSSWEIYQNGRPPWPGLAAYGGLVLGALLLAWLCLRLPWRQTQIGWVADHEGIHVARGAQALQTIPWREVDAVSSRAGVGHGAVAWTGGFRKRTGLPYIKLGDLQALVDHWKRETGAG